MVSPAWAAPKYKVQDMLVPQLQPKQTGVVYSVPSPDDYDACEVKLIRGSKPGSSGFVLFDPKGKPICRFLDNTGNGKVDFWSYYKDGVEIYREWTDKRWGPKEFPRPNQFRWLNSGGMKWGVDVDGDGKIDGWKMISAEEVAEEVFLAARDRDLHRLQALFISENEMQALHLPADLQEKVRGQIKEAPGKLRTTLEKLPALTDKAQFVRVEGAPPQCKLADEAKTETDLFLFPTRAILFKGEDQKHDWLQSGEMIRVGMTWRLLDAPGYVDLSAATNEPSDSKVIPKADTETQALLQKLSDHDKQQNVPPASSGPDAKMVAFNLDRAGIVELILARKPAAERESWSKQVFDNLSTAAQYSDEKDTRAITRLIQMRDQVCKDQPGTNLAAYASFRTLWAQYIPKIAAASGPKGNELQKQWLEELSKFVQTYAKSDDTADALFHLGMGCEAQGLDEEAKRWYQQMVSHFPDHILTPKAAGSKRRLELVGKEFELASPMLSGGDFNIASLKGKLIAVYYWASNCSNCVTDFARLKQLHTMYAAKGLELVLVNLDDTAADATRYLQTNPVPGTQLFQAAKEGGGFNSPLALQYGIQGLPTLFLVGRDGKVISRNMQMADLEDGIRKAP
jgi:thiol-disulfide isomerase/thioredoxin